METDRFYSFFITIQIPGPNTFTLNKVLDIGDKVEVWGTYRQEYSKFSVNLKDVHNKFYFLHVDFRPKIKQHGQTVLNSLFLKGWETEIRCEIPNFIVGERFKITLECRDSEFGIFFNDQELSETFPYRANLSSVKIVSLEGPNNGLLWDNVSLPAQMSLSGIGM